VQDNDLFAQHPPDDEQRFHQYRQVGEGLHKLLDAGLEPYLADRPKLLVLLEHRHLQERPSASAFKGKPLGRGAGFRMQGLGLDPRSAVPDTERTMVPSSCVLPPRPRSAYKAHDRGLNPQAA
jgi:hypothetical protein